MALCSVPFTMHLHGKRGFQLPPGKHKLLSILCRNWTPKLQSSVKQGTEEGSQQGSFCSEKQGEGPKGLRADRLWPWKGWGIRRPFSYSSSLIFNSWLCLVRCNWESVHKEAMGMWLWLSKPEGRPKRCVWLWILNPHEWLLFWGEGEGRCLHYIVDEKRCAPCGSIWIKMYLAKWKDKRCLWKE